MRAWVPGGEGCSWAPVSKQRWTGRRWRTGERQTESGVVRQGAHYPRTLRTQQFEMLVKVMAL